jgi:hypothetical protein
LDNLVLPRVRTSPLQPFNDVEISRAATMAATRQLKDELIVKRGGGGCHVRIEWKAIQSAVHD